MTLVRGRAGEWVEPGTPVLRLVAIDRLRAEGFASADAVDASMLGADGAVHARAKATLKASMPMRQVISKAGWRLSAPRSTP